MQQYKQKLDEYQKNLSSDQINPDLIKQQLILGNETDANMSYKALRNDIKVRYSNNKDITAMKNSKTSITVDTDNTGDLTGNVIEITYSNLSRSSYKGRKISKIVATYSDIIRDKQSPRNVVLRIMSNPFEGFRYFYTFEVKVDYKYYDENNNLINFDNDDSAWITAGSLNAGGMRREEVTLNSKGKAYTFSGSAVTIHDGNTLYSNKATDVGSYGHSWEEPEHDPQPYPWGTANWDNGLDDPHAYFGAGIFKISGSNLDTTYRTTRVNNLPKIYGGWDIWATLSTTIPKGSGPSADIHYKDTEVVLELIFSP